MSNAPSTCQQTVGYQIKLKEDTCDIGDLSSVADCIQYFVDFAKCFDYGVKLCMALDNGYNFTAEVAGDGVIWLADEFLQTVTKYIDGEPIGIVCVA